MILCNNLSQIILKWHGQQIMTNKSLYKLYFIVLIISSMPICVLRSGKVEGSIPLHLPSEICKSPPALSKDEIAYINYYLYDIISDTDILIGLDVALLPRKGGGVSIVYFSDGKKLQDSDVSIIKSRLFSHLNHGKALQKEVIVHNTIKKNFFEFKDASILDSLDNDEIACFNFEAASYLSIGRDGNDIREYPFKFYLIPFKDHNRIYIRSLSDEKLDRNSLIEINAKIISIIQLLRPNKCYVPN